MPSFDNQIHNTEFLIKKSNISYGYFKNKQQNIRSFSFSLIIAKINITPKIS